MGKGKKESTERDGMGMSRRRSIVAGRKPEEKKSEPVIQSEKLPNMDACPTCGRRLKPGRPRLKHDDTGNDAGSDQ